MVYTFSVYSIYCRMTVIVVATSALAVLVLKESELERIVYCFKRVVPVYHVVKEVANAVWRAA